MDIPFSGQFAQYIGYYRDPGVSPNPDDGNNTEDNRVHLRINCAGRCVIPGDFYRYQPGGRNDYYLMYLYSGTLSMFIGEDRNAEYSLMEPGHLFIFPPHITFRYSNAGSDPICYLWAHATGYGVAGLLSDCAIPIGAQRYVGFPPEAEEKFAALFKTFLLRGPCMDVACAAHFMDICAMFGGVFAADAPTGRLQNASAELRDKTRRIYTSLSYLHENLSKPISVVLLAEMENLSVSRYRSLFHDATGMSPITYITGLRMHRAAELLSQTNLQILDIALSVGYEDPQYFSRMFRKTWGVSPAVYGKRRRSTSSASN